MLVGVAIELGDVVMIQSRDHPNLMISFPPIRSSVGLIGVNKGGMCKSGPKRVNLRSTLAHAALRRGTSFFEDL